MLKKHIRLAIFFNLVVNFCFGQFGDKLSVGLIVDSNTALNNRLLQLIQEEASKLLDSRITFAVDKDNVVYADWNESRVSDILNTMLLDGGIEMIIGVGAISSGVLSANGPYNKPVIGTVVINPEIQKLPLTTENTTGIKNLNYTIAPYSPVRDLENFHDMFPFKRLAVLLDENISSQYDYIKAAFDQVKAGLNFSYEVISVGTNAEVVLSKINQEYDAVYYGALFEMAFTPEFKVLIDGVNEKKLPSFSLFGRSAVRKGVMAGIAPESNLTRLARRIALNIRSIVEGANAGKLSVTMNYKEDLVINMETTRKIGFSPNWNVLNEAELLNEEGKEAARKISLQSVIKEALEMNWELAIANKNVAAGATNIQEANAAFLPQLGASASARMIDQDRAEASFGSQPERIALTSATFSQLIYAENASANIKIQQDQQLTREWERKAIEMDVVLKVVQGYLNLLRAKTFERIQKENLRLIRKNLELARVRQAIGYSGPSDLYRWESEIALSKKDLNVVQANRKNAEIALNQILTRPLNEAFETEEVGLDDASLITNDPRLSQYISNPVILEKFTNFLVQEGMRDLPELKRIDAVRSVAQRNMLLNKRNYYIPTVGLEAGLDYWLYRGGAGTSGVDVPIPGIQFPSAPDDVFWNVGVKAALPVFSGFRRNARYQRAVIQLDQVDYQKSNLILQLDQAIRSRLQLVAASYANIQLSVDASEASRKNFELVQDAYSKGIVSIIQLIDAQNAAIRAQQFAANAGYEFVIDLVVLERSIGFFYSLASPEERTAYFERLEQFMEAN